MSRVRLDLPKVSYDTLTEVSRKQIILKKEKGRHVSKSETVDQIVKEWKILMDIQNKLADT